MDEIRLFHVLLLKLGVTLALALVLFSIYFFMARKRAKKVPPGFFAVFVATLSLYILLILNESELIVWVNLWEGVYLWTKFMAYLGTVFLLLKAVDLLVLEDYLIGKKGVYIPGLVRLLIILISLTAAGLVFFRTVLGINVVALIAIPTAATAVIGFALQDTLKRFFAGIMLGKLVRVGDWVSVAGKEGAVTKVDMGHVTILTRQDDHVMIPNNVAAQHDLVNYNKPTTKHARTVLVDAAYDAPPLQVQAILIQAAKAVSGVLAEPPPQAFVVGFRDSSIQYRVKFWIKDFASVPDMEGQVLAYAWYAFKRNGIEMPLPQRTVHMVPTKDADRIKAEEQERILRALQGIDFLSVLAPEHLEVVAKGATTRIYLPGETVVRQGEGGTEFFFILDGSAEVIREVGEERTLTVATLDPMEFFGEMSVLTGEPRSATVVATMRLEVLVITKALLARPIMAHPVLAERISSVLTQRRHDQEAQRLEAAAYSRNSVRAPNDHAHNMGARIRDFFGVAAK